MHCTSQKYPRLSCGAVEVRSGSWIRFHFLILFLNSKWNVIETVIQNQIQYVIVWLRDCIFFTVEMGRINERSTLIYSCLPDHFSPLFYIFANLIIYLTISYTKPFLIYETGVDYMTPKRYLNSLLAYAMLQISLQKQASHLRHFWLTAVRKWNPLNCCHDYHSGFWFLTSI